MTETIERAINQIEIQSNKHGYWITIGVRDLCSVCNISVMQPHINRDPIFKYCPYCGAKMDSDNSIGDLST